jgi:transcriptional regulator with XRE-family HTH domain
MRLREGQALPDRGSPAVRGRRLAAELRRLRERTGLTGEEVAERLGWSGSKISRIELQRTGVKDADLHKLLDLYGVGEGRRQELQALAHESSQKSLMEIITANFPANYAAYLRAEAEAQSVWNWDPQIVPGLLQTPEYARAVKWSAWQRPPRCRMSRCGFTALAEIALPLRPARFHICSSRKSMTSPCMTSCR